MERAGGGELGALIGGDAYVWGGGAGECRGEPRESEVMGGGREEIQQGRALAPLPLLLKLIWMSFVFLLKKLTPLTALFPLCSSGFRAVELLNLPCDGGEARTWIASSGGPLRPICDGSKEGARPKVLQEGSACILLRAERSALLPRRQAERQRTSSRYVLSPAVDCSLPLKSTAVEWESSVRPCRTLPQTYSRPCQLSTRH